MLLPATSSVVMPRVLLCCCAPVGSRDAVFLRHCCLYVMMCHVDRSDDCKLVKCRVVIVVGLVRCAGGLACPWVMGAARYDVCILRYMHPPCNIGVLKDLLSSSRSALSHHPVAAVLCCAALLLLWCCACL